MHLTAASTIDENQIEIGLFEGVVCLFYVVAAVYRVATVDDRIFERDYERILSGEHEQNLSRITRN